MLRTLLMVSILAIPIHTKVIYHHGVTPSPTVTPLIVTPTPTWAPFPAHCPWVPDFIPNKMVQINGLEAQTVLGHDGCPALLVLIPITKDNYQHVKEKTTNHGK